MNTKIKIIIIFITATIIILPITICWSSSKKNNREFRIEDFIGDWNSVQYITSTPKYRNQYDENDFTGEVVRINNGSIINTSGISYEVDSYKIHTINLQKHLKEFGITEPQEIQKIKSILKESDLNITRLPCIVSQEKEERMVAFILSEEQIIMSNNFGFYYIYERIDYRPEMFFGNWNVAKVIATNKVGAFLKPVGWLEGKEFKISESEIIIGEKNYKPKKYYVEKMDILDYIYTKNKLSQIDVFMESFNDRTEIDILYFKEGGDNYGVELACIINENQIVVRYEDTWYLCNKLKL